MGSQANRIEPIFADEKYKALVPQVVVRAGEKEVHLLEAGHRAGDAIVRCTELQKPLQDAFKSVLKGDAEPLAKIAPTSLVFGVWDSRDTQAKLPRVVASTIRAFNVRKLTRSAQYIPATEYVADKLLDEPADKPTRDAYAERGFIHVPATGSHGGVIADGGIRRDATLGLAALRLLRAGKDDKKTLALRRYILGLALIAFTHNPSGYLRQGCLLVLDPKKPREFVEVYPNGKRETATVSHQQALAYAKAAAKAFGVGEDRTVAFDKERAKKDVKGDGDTKTKGKKGKKADRRRGNVMPDHLPHHRPLPPTDQPRPGRSRARMAALGPPRLPGARRGVRRRLERTDSTRLRRPGPPLAGAAARPDDRRRGRRRPRGRSIDSTCRITWATKWPGHGRAAIRQRASRATVPRRMSARPTSRRRRRRGPYYLWAFWPTPPHASSRNTHEEGSHSPPLEASPISAGASTWSRRMRRSSPRRPQADVDSAGERWLVARPTTAPFGDRPARADRRDPEPPSSRNMTPFLDRTSVPMAASTPCPPLSTLFRVGRAIAVRDRFPPRRRFGRVLQPPQARRKRLPAHSTPRAPPGAWSSPPWSGTPPAIRRADRQLARMAPTRRSVPSASLATARAPGEPHAPGRRRSPGLSSPSPASSPRGPGRGEGRGQHPPSA